ncbi:hypothetical protein Emag_006342 [Eimeria magna]
MGSLPLFSKESRSGKRDSRLNPLRSSSSSSTTDAVAPCCSPAAAAPAAPSAAAAMSLDFSSEGEQESGLPILGTRTRCSSSNRNW